MTSSSPPIRARNGTSGSAIRSTTSMPARCRRRGCRSASRLLLNLVAVASTDDKDLLWGFVKRYAPEASPETHPELDALLDFALAYFRDFIADSLRRRAPTRDGGGGAARPRRAAGGAAGGRRRRGRSRPRSTRSARRTGFENLRDWFRALYETLLGTSQGPRMGSFIALYGIDNSRKLIAEALGAR